MKPTATMGGVGGVVAVSFIFPGGCVLCVPGELLSDVVGLNDLAGAGLNCIGFREDHELMIVVLERPAVGAVDDLCDEERHSLASFLAELLDDGGQRFEGFRCFWSGLLGRSLFRGFLGRSGGGGGFSGFHDVF